MQSYSSGHKHTSAKLEPAAVVALPMATSGGSDALSVSVAAPVVTVIARQPVGMMIFKSWCLTLSVAFYLHSQCRQQKQYINSSII